MAIRISIGLGLLASLALIVIGIRAVATSDLLSVPVMHMTAGHVLLMLVFSVYVSTRRGS